MNDMQKLAESYEGVKKYVKFLKEQGYTPQRVYWVELCDVKSFAGQVSWKHRFDIETEDWLCLLRVRFARDSFIDREVFHSTAAHEAIHCMEENTDMHRKTFKEMAKKLNDEFDFEFPVRTCTSGKAVMREIECKRKGICWESKYKYAVRCKMCNCYVKFYEELPEDIIFDKYATHGECAGPVEVIDIQNKEEKVKEIPVCIE